MRRISDRIAIREVIKVKLVIIIGLGLFSCAPEIKPETSVVKSDSQLSAHVIYGVDGRLDLYQVTDDRLKALADSTVALVKTNQLSNSGQFVQLNGKNYGNDLNLCPEENFREQDTAAFCSGSLVGEDLILTAGHCIETATDCASTSFVFGFAVQSSESLPKNVPSQEVYRCKEIIKTVRKNAGADFAVIRLDRKVLNHKPLKVRSEGDVDLNASLVVIGHPVGLPTKITTGGSVRSVSPAEHFVTNLDTYGGNSGSSVFNLQTGLIEGVLVRGEQDFVTKGSCVVSKTCADSSCRGEDVTKISVIRPFIPQTHVVEPPPAPETEKFENNVAVSIPDNNSKGVTSQMVVNSKPAGRKVFVSVNIKHTYIGDLSIKVVSPDGQTVVLHQRAGGSADDINKTFEVTSTLGKVQNTGNYKLILQDLAKLDLGQLVSWSIEFK